LRIQTDPQLPVAELLERGREAIRELEELGNEAALADAWDMLAWFPWIACRAEETDQALQKALAYARSSGARRAEIHALTLMLGVMTGELELAEERLREAYGILEPMGEKSGLSTVTAILAEVLYRMDRHDDALEAAAASAEAAPPDDLSSQVQWRGTRAKVLAT